MDSIVVAAIAGIAALATPLVTWVVVRRKASDLRASIARDNELRAALDPDGSAYARELLRWNIDQNSYLLVHRERMRASGLHVHRLALVGFWVAALSLIFGQLSKIGALDGLKSELTFLRVLFLVLAVLGAALTVRAAITDSKGERTIIRHLKAIDDAHPFRIGADGANPPVDPNRPENAA